MRRIQHLLHFRLSTFALLGFLGLFFTFFFSVCDGSSGDRSFSYQACLRHCVETKEGCPKPTDYFLQLFFWTCETNCQYLCMWKASTSTSTPMEQYYGKWPFLRVFGMQEVVSVAMSVANGYQHYKGYQKLISLTRKSGSSSYSSSSTMPFSYQKQTMLMMIPPWVPWFYYASLNLWVWSSVFHARDTWWTERLDYLSASLGNVFQLMGGVCHCWGWSWKYAVVFVGFMFGGHVYRLTPSWLNYRIDYGYNMKFNLCVASLLWLIWMSWGLQQWYLRRTKSSIYLVFTLLGMACALAFEIIDFPPYFYLLDSHALWHALTVPFVYTWYQFIYYEVLQQQEANTLKLPTSMDKID
ncbi:hypothetical protein HMI54_004897 [Coelomomyces lativittatus]|nr:hypothetical protein HMI55_003571 [Coelomomyces lativittatus]KAJ1506621.1 hypothetical protein HMI54_004897 [Coelomomyces lativittatus]KAJ1512799.1 hypothetical protein HMI56_003524 [Coelomomyces lativittatus]